MFSAFTGIKPSVLREGYAVASWFAERQQLSPLNILYRQQASSREKTMALLVPVIADSLFFDDVFDEMNREMVRMHHDMRHAMNRITPRQPLSGADSIQQQLDKMREPIITKEDGSKELCLKFDVGSFKPDEISVKTKDGEVQLEAKHEEKTDNSRVFHHFSRHFSLPQGVEEDKITSSLSKDGVLLVRAPVNPPAIEQSTEIPVLKEK